MKKLISIIAFVLMLLLFTVAYSVVHYANQVTIAWDPVTQTIDSLPLPVGQVSYEVYLKTGTVEVLYGEIGSTQITLTFNDYNEYDVGVRAVLTQGANRFYSNVAWSSVEGKPIPFTVWRPVVLKNPGNIHYIE